MEYLEGRTLAEYRQKELARRLSYVPQADGRVKEGARVTRQLGERKRKVLLRVFSAVDEECLVQAGLPLAILALAGLVIGVWKKRIVLAFAALVAMFGIHYAVYSIPDIDSHLFPALIGMGVLAGFGTERIARLASRSFPRGALVITACAFLLIVPNLARIRPRADEYFAIDYANAIQESARKACGDSCISRDKTCNVGPGCACQAPGT